MLLGKSSKVKNKIKPVGMHETQAMGKVSAGLLGLNVHDWGSEQLLCHARTWHVQTGEVVVS